MQTQIRDKLTVRYAKVDVIINQWNKTIGKMMEHAISINDKSIITICDEIIKVP